MELQLPVILWVLQFRLYFGCDVVKPYQNKRLLAMATTILNITIMTSEEQCVMFCYYETPGCLAVNIIATNDITRCEMTTGLSNETDMVDDSTSVLYVSDYNKCTEHPGFCQNGGTCQATWTSARCHCTDSFQGDRCKRCADRRFEGDECDTCASGHYGNTCGYTFTRHNASDCLYHQNLHHMTSRIDSDYESCKHWCVNNTTCGGFAGAGDDCYFKRLACKGDVFAQLNVHLYLKEIP